MCSVGDGGSFHVSMPAARKSCRHVVQLCPERLGESTGPHPQWRLSMAAMHRIATCSNAFAPKPLKEHPVGKTVSSRCAIVQTLKLTKQSDRLPHFLCIGFRV